MVSLLESRGFKILRDAQVGPIHLRLNDTLNVSYNGKLLYSEPIKKKIVCDRVIIFGVENELGFKTGMGCIVGEAD